MKLRILAVLLLLCMFICTACGAEENLLRISMTGDSWIAGFESTEIAIPETQDPLYLAGYRGGAEYEGILDLPRASAVWMGTEDDGGILLIGIDCIGLGADTVARIRAMLAPFAEESGCAAIAVYATHTHAGMDTLGLWGPTAQDGKNEQYMDSLLAAAADAAQRAYDARKSGTLYFSQTATEGLQTDSRAPYVYDTNLYQLRFQPEDGTPGGRIVFFGTHAESLRGENRLLSRDFPGVMADTVSAETGETMLFVPGAIGGLVLTPELYAGDAETVSDFYAENCRVTGEMLADIALSVTEEVPLAPSLAYAETTFSVPLDNTLFLYYKFLGILGNPITDGADSETGYALTSTCAALRLGDTVTAALLPGEVFPELVYTDTEFRMAGAGYQLLDTTFPSLSRLAEQYGCGTLLICGLANDELGYILPPESYMVNPDLPYFDGITDESGENHYEETMSAGIRTAQSLFSAMETVFAALG